MNEGSAIASHLQTGHERLARVDEAVAAFRRLHPADYDYFFVMIERALGAGDLNDGDLWPQIVGPKPAAEEPTVAPAKGPATPRGTGLASIVLAVLSDGKPRTTSELRAELAARKRTHTPQNLHTTVYTLRKQGHLISKGRGKGTQHTLAASGRQAAKAPKKPARGASDDESEGAPAAAAREICAAIAAGRHLLTGAEELALARRLEDVEIEIWRQLLVGPWAAEAQQALRDLEPTASATEAGTARALDLDRRASARVIAAHPSAELHALTAESDRIRGTFVACNTRLVWAILRKRGYFHNTAINAEDLVQEGNLGLLKAIPRYDYRRGLRFSTFAVWWIRHQIVRARQDHGSDVRIPVHLQELFAKAKRTRVLLQTELGREPTSAELRRALNVTTNTMAALHGDLLRTRVEIPSFDSVGDSDSGESPSILISADPQPDAILSDHQRTEALVAALATLPPHLAVVLRKRYGLDGDDEKTLAEVGADVDLSRERIRQLEKVALQQLRRRLDAAA